MPFYPRRKPQDRPAAEGAVGAGTDLGVEVGVGVQSSESEAARRLVADGGLGAPSGTVLAW